MLASKPYALPLAPGLSSYLARSTVTRKGAFRVPLPKQNFHRTTTLSVDCYTSQKCLLNTISRPYSSIHCASTPTTRDSVRPLLRPLTIIQRSGLAKRSTEGLRPFLLFNKQHQHRHYPGSRYKSYRTDSFTVSYRTAQLAFLGTFLAIYLALQDKKQPNRVGSLLQERPPKPTSILESIQQHLTSVRVSIQKYLTYQNLTFRPREWPPSTLAQCIPYVGHIFAHESATHLAMNSISFYFLTSFLFPYMGVFTTATTFIAGGIMASQLDCATATAYAKSWSPWHNIVGSLHASPRDPNPNETLGAGRLGASAGLCTLFTVLAISNPLARGRFLLIPISFPIWSLWCGEVAWEGYNFYYNVEDGIGHGGHLAGHVAGAVLWLVALRWTRYGRLCRQVRWA
jgi:membrane associated rhomboid family serine protease